MRIYYAVLDIIDTVLIITRLQRKHLNSMSNNTAKLGNIFYIKNWEIEID